MGVASQRNSGLLRLVLPPRRGVLGLIPQSTTATNSNMEDGFVLEFKKDIIFVTVGVTPLPKNDSGNPSLTAMYGALYGI